MISCDIGALQAQLDGNGKNFDENAFRWAMHKGEIVPSTLDAFSKNDGGKLAKTPQMKNLTDFLNEVNKTRAEKAKKKAEDDARKA